VTTDNDTPQMFGEGPRHDVAFDPEWHDGTDDAAYVGADLAEDPDGPAEMDQAEEASEADPRTPTGQHPASVYLQGSGPFPEQDRSTSPAVNAWAGRGERTEPDAGGNGYPWPSSYPAGPAYPEELGSLQALRQQSYPDRLGHLDSFRHPQPPEYPQGPGFAPVPRDYPGPAEPGYPVGPGYAPGPGNPHEPGYPQDTWNGVVPGSAQDPGCPQGWGYGQDAQTVPPMEPLPEPSPAGYRGRTGVLAGRVPRQRRAPGLTPQASAEPGYERETSESLTAESLLNGPRPGLMSGWRRGVHRITGGLFRLGESAADMHRRDLINRVRTPVAGGHHRVAVLSLKGGVGKTTTAVGLGATLATLRGDRVIAVDANPDRGTLSDKVRLETAATIRDLLNERVQVRRYADVRAFTSQAPSRLEVLASDRDPGVSVAFGADDYRDAARLLEHFYSICLTDCGTGLLHSAMAGVLRLADQIVVVSSPSVDGARSASATLDWLEAHGCGDLVRNGVVVLSTIRPKSKSNVDLDRLEHHFATRCRAVVRIPYDPHLEEGAEVDLELLGAETADAYLTLAAIVGDGLAWPRRLTYRSALP
jgi:MinD-like ATPase involved in chromosome partitioning or flagellar assembly